MHQYVGDDVLLCLSVPHVVQATEYTCGPASLSAVLGFYGFSYKEDDLIDYLSTTKEWGTEPYDMISFVEGLGLNVVGRMLTLDDLCHYLKKCVPVILAVQEWATAGTDLSKTKNDGHYIVAVGYTDDGVLFQDSSMQSGIGFLSFDELLERWHDYDRSGKCLKQYGIVISRGDSSVV